MVSEKSIDIVTFYHFIDIHHPAEFVAWVKEEADAREIRGILLIAKEGLNATLSGSRNALKDLILAIENELPITLSNQKWSHAQEHPFRKLKVKEKAEIITFKVDGIDPNEKVGTYVRPSEWNDLINRDDVTLVDTRNDYEVAVGTFKGALDPNTESFTEFVDYVRENLDPQKHKKVAMFCTGGVRCEKASAFMLKEGFEEIYHLEGGILKYLEEVPKAQSEWEGDCFVFDHRVTVKHDLNPGDYSMCWVCGWPLMGDDLQHEHFEHGVSCHKCFGTRNDAQMERARMRQRNIEIARARGLEHIGPDSQH